MPIRYRVWIKTWQGPIQTVDATNYVAYDRSATQMVIDILNNSSVTIPSSRFPVKKAKDAEWFIRLESDTVPCENQVYVVTGADDMMDSHRDAEVTINDQGEISPSLDHLDPDEAPF